MADEQLDRLESFRVFITAAEEGAAIPPVAEHDLKCLHELSVERAKRYCGKDGVVSMLSPILPRPKKLKLGPASLRR
jgi:hypothetical protein